MPAVLQGDAGDGGSASAAADVPDQAARIKMAVELLKEAGDDCSILCGVCCVQQLCVGGIEHPLVTMCAVANTASDVLFACCHVLW
jgi:hypothetical protein